MRTHGSKECALLVQRGRTSAAAAYAINGHASLPKITTYIACRDIPGAAASESLTIQINQLNNSGLTGTATLIDPSFLVSRLLDRGWGRGRGDERGRGIGRWCGVRRGADLDGSWLGGSGLCVTKALRALTSARVAVVDRHDDRLQLARQFGVELALHSGRDDVAARVRTWNQGALADCVIEVTGKTGGAQLALSLIRPQGRLVVYGVFDDLVPLDLTAVTLSELEVVGAVGSPGTYPLALELAMARRVELAPIVSRVVALSDLPELFSASGGGAAERKSVVVFDERTDGPDSTRARIADKPSNCLTGDHLLGLTETPDN